MKPFKFRACTLLFLLLVALLMTPSGAQEDKAINKQLKKLDNLFTKVNSDMDTLKEDMSDRQVRAAAAAQETCPLTKSNLLNLRKSLNDRLKAASGSRCNIDMDSTSYCTEMVTLVQCAINAIKVGYIDAVQSSASMKMVETISRTFNGVTEVYTKEINVVKKSMTVKQHWFDAEKLHKDLERLRKQLDETTKKLQERTNDLVSSYIIRGKIDKAIKSYNTLEAANGTALPGIIEACYRDVKAKKGSNPLVMKNFHRILQFVEKLPGAGDLQVMGYKTLESEMKRAKLEKSVQVVQFSSALKTVQVTSNSSQTEVNSVLKNLQPYVDFLVIKWARGIAKSSRNAMSDLRKLGKYRFNALKSIMAPLVVQAYGGKMSRLTEILLFLKRTPSLEARIEGLEALARQMASKSQFDSPGAFLLAYQINKVYVHKRYVKIAKESKVQLDAVKALLPENVREIVLGGTSCKITNRRYKISLYADRQNRDKKRKFVYLWSPAQSKLGDRWSFETPDGGKTWYIKNDQYQGYLMAESSAYNSVEGRRSTFVWRKKNSKTTGAKWYLNSTDGGKSVVFKNVFRNSEYMFASRKHRKDSHRLNLFTWQRGKPKGLMMKRAQFEVKCGKQ